MTTVGPGRVGPCRVDFCSEWQKLCHIWVKQVQLNTFCSIHHASKMLSFWVRAALKFCKWNSSTTTWDKALLRARFASLRFARNVVVDEFHLQNLKIALTRKLSILEACCIEQKVFGCTCFTHIWYNFCHPEQKSTRPDPTRPSRFWAAYYSKTMSFREKNYETKNIGLYHKSYVLKFGGVPLCSL